MRVAFKVRYVFMSGLFLTHSINIYLTSSLIDYRSVLSLWSLETAHDFMLRDKKLIQDIIVAVVLLSRGSSSKVRQANFLCSNAFIAFAKRTLKSENWKLCSSCLRSNKKAF